MTISELSFFIGQIIFIPVYLVATAKLSDSKLKVRHYLGYLVISPFSIYFYTIVLYGLLSKPLSSLFSYDFFYQLVTYGDVLSLLLSFLMGYLYACRKKGKARLLRFYVYACFYMSSMVFTVTYDTTLTAVVLGILIPIFFAVLTYFILVVPLDKIKNSTEYFHGFVLFFPIASEFLLILRFLLGLIYMKSNQFTQYDSSMNWYMTTLGYIAYMFVVASMALTNRDIQSIREIDDKRKELVTVNGRIRNLSVDIMLALAATIDAKDSYTQGHSSRVAEYSERIAKHMGHDEDYISKLRKAALLHDIGKIAIPDAIINKRGKLQDGEYRLMKEHPKKGYEILSKIEEMPELPLGALYHHERWDGKGYPTGIRGEDIPEIARIISVADAYDAMTSNRNYRAALSFEKVRGEIRNGVGSQFDPAVAQALLELMDQGLGTITEEMNS